MAWRDIDQETYDRLVFSYREYPGNYTNAARYAGCTAGMAKRAWLTGWPKVAWAKPIAQVFEEEVQAARAERMRKEREAEAKLQDQRLTARLDALEARVQEAQGSKLGRGNAIGFAAASARLVNSANVLASEIQRRVGDPQNPQRETLAKMSLGEIRSTLTMIGAMVERSERVMQLALAIERVVQGEPVAVLGLQVSKMSPEQMVAQLEGVQRTLARAQRAVDRGALPPEALTSPEASVKDVSAPSSSTKNEAN